MGLEFDGFGVVFASWKALQKMEKPLNSLYYVNIWLEPGGT
jgi:hypothetical protein